MLIPPSEARRDRVDGPLAPGTRPGRGRTRKFFPLWPTSPSVRAAR